MAMVKVGPGTWVEAADVVAIHPHVEPMAYDVEPYVIPKPRSAIVLRNGKVVPGYNNPDTIQERIHKAKIQGPIRPRHRVKGGVMTELPCLLPTPSPRKSGAAGHGGQKAAPDG